MIEFHEDEYSNYALSDLSMRRVALLLGPECATKLLYSGDKSVRINHRVRTRRMEEWREPVIDWDSLISATQASEGKGKAETPLSVDVRQRFRSS